MKKIILFFILFSTILFANDIKTYKVSYDPDYAPYSYNINNEPFGLFIEIYKEIAKKNNIKIKFIAGKNWNDAISLVQKGKVDFFLGTNPYEEWMIYSKPYYKTDTAFFSLTSFNRSFKTIGIIGEDYKDELFKVYKNVKIKSFTTYKTLVDALIKKEVDIIYDDSIALSQYILKESKNHIIRKLNIFSTTNDICALSNNTKNRDLFDSWFQKLDQKDLTLMEDNWISDSSQKYYEKIKKDIFTQEEKEWMLKNPIIRIAVMNYWASDLYGNNLHTEVLKLIDKYAGTHMVAIKFDNWQEAFNTASNGINLNGIMGLSYTKEREKRYFYYTKPYSFDPYYLVTRHNNTTIKSLNDIKNKSVYIQEKTIIYDTTRKSFPSTKVIPVNTLEAAYHQLTSHKGDEALLSYFVHEEDLKKYNLKIVDTLYDKYGEVSIGIHHNSPLLASIINKAFTLIPKAELAYIRNKTYEKEKPTQMNQSEEISFVGLLSTEELLFAFFLLLLLGYIVYTQFSKTNILNVKLNIFNIMIVGFELAMILFLVYEIVVLDRTEHNLAQAYNEKLQMTQAISELRQSSDDLTHFARTYTITNNQKFKQQYFDTLAIRNGEIARPQGYEGIYWDLDKGFRTSKHPPQKKISLKNLILKLPFTQIEREKFEQSEKNSNELVNLEVQAFKEMENNMQHHAVKLLHSVTYYQSKQQIMLPIDDLIMMLENRTSSEIYQINIKIKQQFLYILFVGIFFILGNLLIYLLLRKKINDPVDYLTDVIKQFQCGAKKIKRKEFYLDEIGEMNTEFFNMKDIIDTQQSNLTNKIEELDIAKKEVDEIHKHTRESIEYASLIQGALIPDNHQFKKYFQDYFTIWQPKDIVGGDIYLFNELNEDECLLMLIDCTGHGVPGAFVTMIVKAIERQIIAEIIHSKEIVSPAKILSIFNKSIKSLLKQDSKDAISNAGFDGGIMYFNKKENIIKYSGANTPLFYIDNDKKLQTIKSSRHSIGYKSSDADFVFQEYLIPVEKEMSFYITTDGYLDQNGGLKGFPFGKSRFRTLINENSSKPMIEQKEILLYEIEKYEKINIDQTRNDDMTIVGFTIK